MILRPDRPVGWQVHFSYGVQCSSDTSLWSDFSQVEVIDGRSLFLSREPIQKLLLWVLSSTRPPLLVLPKEPVRMFALTRMTTTSYEDLPAGTATWLYSLFGFYEGKYRKMFFVSPDGVESLLEQRGTPFSL